MTGLYDLHLIGNELAYPMMIKMIDYHLARIRNVIKLYSIWRWEQILEVE